MIDDNEINIPAKDVSVSAKLPFELHLAAKGIYSMQGTSIGKRVENLIKADLKKTMTRDWFKQLPENEVAIYKILLRLSERE
ncbi:hypothetical protein [Limnohabitans sp.]|uniref:hypothetical protein n=1 Tax=Limnohabitans sp. TaxID=1907725 RepID=UPI0035ADCC0A